MTANTITSLTDPKFANVEKTAIRATVILSNIPNKTHPFTATSTDDDPRGKQVWEDLMAGKYGPIAPYKADPAIAKAKATADTAQAAAKAKIQAAKDAETAAQTAALVKAATENPDVVKAIAAAIAAQSTSGSTNLAPNH